MNTDFGYDDSRNHIPGVIQNDPIVESKTVGNDKAYDFLNYVGIGAESGNFLESSINKSDFLIGSYNSSNAIDFGSNIVPGQFNLYEKGYQESLSQLKFLKNTSKVVGKGGYYLGYLEGVDKAMHGDLKGGIVSAGSNYAAEAIAMNAGFGYGLAFTLTWELMDKNISQTEWYNRLFFGKESDVYIERGLRNGWYFDHWYKP